jgi:hypothetical protein
MCLNYKYSQIGDNSEELSDGTAPCFSSSIFFKPKSTQSPSSLLLWWVRTQSNTKLNQYYSVLCDLCAKSLRPLRLIGFNILNNFSIKIENQ